MSLRFENITLFAASLGGELPLPSMEKSTFAFNGMRIDDSVYAEEREYIEYGAFNGSGPYLKQNCYDRVRKPRQFRAAVLENERLKAVFLPGLGGRLWQLWDKRDQRDLLFTNPVFQPAHLSLRDAWFAGGVEFNCGVRGHTALSCSPLFTASWKMEDGTDVLRLYEYERIRRVVYIIDAALPAGSDFLFLSVKIRNTLDETVPIYWWSNIAVPELPDTRILAPAEKAFRWSYGAAFSKESVPCTESDGYDTSYPMRAPHALDLFFDIPRNERPFVAVADRDGCGLLHCSTRRLKGRKFFVWGTGTGGCNWQRHLCGSGVRYMEVQAGLGRFQMECLPMPAHTVWDWVEAYGPLEAEPFRVHGEYPDAVSACREYADDVMPMEKLEAMQKRFLDEAPAFAPSRTAGSGWGALEEKRRGEKLDPALDFEGSLTDRQAPWTELIESGHFPCPAPEQYPFDWQFGPEWAKLLDTPVNEKNWYAQLHLGLLYYGNDEHEKAECCWKKSIALCPSAWAFRCLGRLSALAGDDIAAAQYYEEALKLLPLDRGLVTEAVTAFIGIGRSGRALATLEALPADMQAGGRLRFLRARALNGVGRSREALAILEDRHLVIDDYREGEESMYGVWSAVVMGAYGISEEQAAKEHPLPRHLDFRHHSA